MTHKELKELMEKAKSAPPGPYTEFAAAANPQVVLDLCERVLGLSEALESLRDISHQVFYRWVDQKSGTAIFMNSMKEKADKAKEALARFGVKQ